MRRNRGATTLKTTRRARNPMNEYDRLMLPWRAATVQKAYDKAIALKGDHEEALSELDRLQRALVAKDAVRVWGTDHPDAAR